MNMNKINLFAIPFLMAPLAFAQQGERHMDRRFDPQKSAASFDAPEREAWQKPGEVIAALGLKAGQTVADIGAGTGYFTVRLAKSNPGVKVIASDLEPSMVDYIRERVKKEGLSNVTTVVATADDARLPEAVDCILMVNTYHHIANRVAYFDRLRTSLKPGGKLAIVDYRKDSPQGPPAEYRMEPAVIESELAKAGYKQVARHDLLPRQEFLVFTLNPLLTSSTEKTWDNVYGQDAPPLTGPPSEILTRAAKLIPAGRALDFGMGMGRNAQYLASLGWDVTGVDISGTAVRRVSEAAGVKGLKITAVRADLREWDLGENRWDLIVAANMHTLLVEQAERIIRALKPGGLLVVEGFHADVRQATKFKGILRVPQGHATNQLPQIFSSLRVLTYEDTLDIAAWRKGPAEAPSRVHLIAIKGER